MFRYHVIASLLWWSTQYFILVTCLDERYTVTLNGNIDFNQNFIMGENGGQSVVHETDVANKDKKKLILQNTLQNSVVKQIQSKAKYGVSDKNKNNKLFSKFVKTAHKREIVTSPREDSYCIHGECLTTILDVKDMCRNCDQVCHYVPSTGSMGFIKCGCYHGFAIGSDWQHCLDIDECLVNPLLCYNGDCLNTIGSFICRCQPGYQLVEHVCVDIDECSSGKSTCEQICTNVPGTFQCSCYKGYSLSSSSTCQDIDECKYNVCSHYCRNILGSFICHCPPHMKLHFDRRTCISFGTHHHKEESKRIVLMYTNNGKLRSDSLKPLSISENSNGRHVIIHNHESISLSKNYTKPNISFKSIVPEIEKNVSATPVLNHKHAGIKSNKKPNKKFTGVHHQNVIQKYNVNQRQNRNNGIARQPPKHVNFNGLKDVSGASQTLNVSLMNNAVYSNLCLSSNCSEKNGYKHGSTTSTRTDHCHLACRNGGTCNINNKCNCKFGFRGRYCQVDVNECLEHPKHCDYLCVNLYGGFQCLCPDGYIVSNDQKSCVNDLSQKDVMQEVDMFLTNPYPYVEVTPSFESEIFTSVIKETPSDFSFSVLVTISKEDVRLSFISPTQSILYNYETMKLNYSEVKLMSFNKSVEINNPVSDTQAILTENILISTVYPQTSSILPTLLNKSDMAMPEIGQNESILGYLHESEILLESSHVTDISEYNFKIGVSYIQDENEVLISTNIFSDDNLYTENWNHKLNVTETQTAAPFNSLTLMTPTFNVYSNKTLSISLLNSSFDQNHSNSIFDTFSSIFTFIFGSSENSSESIMSATHDNINTVTEKIILQNDSKTYTSMSSRKHLENTSLSSVKDTRLPTSESSARSVSNPLFFVDVPPSLIPTLEKQTNDTSHSVTSSVIESEVTNINSSYFLSTEKEQYDRIIPENAKMKKHRLRKPSIRKDKENKVKMKKKKKSKHKLLRLSSDFQVLSQVLELVSDDDMNTKGHTKFQNQAHSNQSDYYLEFLDYDSEESVNNSLFMRTDDVSTENQRLISWNISKFPNLSLNWHSAKNQETDCYYGIMKIKSGDTFFRDSKNCSKCFCKNGEMFCDPLHCPSLHCTEPLQAQCCSYCASDCVIGNDVFLHGERFILPSDPCRECHCLSGQVNCENILCEKPNCPKELQNIPHTECCPTCLPADQGCYSRGRFFVEGQLWVKQENGCQACLCKGSKILCKPVICSVSCEYPQFIVGECCPVCDGCQHYERKYTNEQEFQHPIDMCSACKCQNGNITCYALPCATNCTHPYKIPGECCPRCHDCQLDGRKINNGENIVINNGSCYNCSCNNGNVICLETECAKDCIVENQVISSGMEFHIGYDICTKCHCWDGTVTCKAVECHDSCSHGVLLPDQCCLDCSKCDYEGKLYEDKETFQHIQDKCKTCHCVRGSVHCEKSCRLENP